MSQTNFSYEATSQSISRIEAATNSAKTELNNVRDAIDTQMGNVNVWSGDSAETVKANWMNFISNFDTFVAKFNLQSSKAREAAKIFGATDDAAGQL